MEKRRRNIFALGVLAAFLLIAFSPTLLHWREPSCEGRNVTFWLHQLKISGRNREARAALQQIGADALPWIMPMFHAKDSRIKNDLESWISQQPLIDFQFNHANEEWFRGVQAIQILGPRAKPAIPALSAMLAEPPIASFAAQALAGIGPDALPALVQALTNRSPMARSAALFGVSNLGPNAESALPALIPALQDSDPGVCRAALDSIIRAGQNRRDLVVSVLLNSLQTGDAMTRGSVIMALSELGTNQPALLVPAFMKGLEDVDPRVRFSAATALGRFKTNALPAVPKMLELLQNARARGGGAIARALKEIIGAEAVLPICQAVANRPPTVQARMLSLLADFGKDAEPAVPTLIGLVKAENEEVRLTAIHTLGKIRRNPAVVVPRLIESLAANDEVTQLAAATALSSFGGEAKEAAPMLLELARKDRQSGAPVVAGRLAAKGFTLPTFQRNENTPGYIPFLSFKLALEEIDPEAAKLVAQ